MVGGDEEMWAWNQIPGIVKTLRECAISRFLSLVVVLAAVIVEKWYL